LQYAWPEGFGPLRQRIAERIAARGAKVKADDVIITNGAQQAITIAAQLVLRPGATIGVDAESYPSALDAFRTLGFVPTVSGQARLLYRMPAVSNPRGVGMTDGERTQALAARRWVIEDDAYGDLRFAGPAPRPLLAAARDRVLYVGTFSKTLGPGLRLGFLIVPPSLQARALRRKADDDLQANSLSQALVEDYLAHQDFEAFTAGLRRHYARRAERLMKAVRRYLPAWSFAPPEGGFGLWVRTDHRAHETTFLQRAVQAGVSFDPGSPFVCAPSRDEPTALRLCFSSVREDAMEEGVRRLARAWRSATRVGVR
jgi:2-aminoadipate transaminase